MASWGNEKWILSGRRAHRQWFQSHFYRVSWASFWCKWIQTNSLGNEKLQMTPRLMIQLTQSYVLTILSSLSWYPLTTCLLETFQSVLCFFFFFFFTHGYDNNAPIRAPGCWGRVRVESHWTFKECGCWQKKVFTMIFTSSPGFKLRPMRTWLCLSPDGKLLQWPRHLAVSQLPDGQNLLKACWWYFRCDWFYLGRQKC